jgi:hypothetical protein
MIHAISEPISQHQKEKFKTSSLQVDNVYAFLLLFSSFSILVGVLWDISWHMSIGRDTLFSPPHLAIYLGGILAGISSIAKTIHTSFFALPNEQQKSIRFWGLRAPLGAMFGIWGAGAMLTSAPFDDWWHNTYGLDVKILSPPHALLAMGIWAIQLGAMFSILAIQNRNSSLSTFWKNAYIISVGICFTLIYIFVIEHMAKSRMHHPLFYQVAGAVLPLVLLSGSSAGKVQFPTAKVALVYMGIFILALWISPLFPAEAKLSPVRNPIDHFVPLPFPLLLVFPALALDLIYRRVGNLSLWKKSLLSAIGFLLVLFAVQYFFSAFLLSPAARNWVFGAHELAFYMSPDYKYRYAYVPFEGSNFAYAQAMLIALGLTFVSCLLGLRWGMWMKKIQR